MTSRAAEDIELLNRYLGGDVAAFDELVRAHEDRVFGVCLRMMRDRDAALDAVQETFVTVFRKLRPDIENALSEMPEEFRAAVVLVDLEGLSLEQAAEILDKPIGTIKSRLFRGRRILAEALGNLREGSRHQKEE